MYIYIYQLSSRSRLRKSNFLYEILDFVSVLANGMMFILLYHDCGVATFPNRFPGITVGPAFSEYGVSFILNLYLSKGS